MALENENVVCPNCKKKLRPPFKCCIEGHIVCGLCRQHQDNATGGMDDSKNCVAKVFSMPVLNDLCRTITDKCQYGCGYEHNLIKLERHEDNCIRYNRLVKCGFPDCQWFDVLTKLVEHVDNYHQGMNVDLSDRKQDVIISTFNPVLLLTQFAKNATDNEVYFVRLFENNGVKRLMIMYFGRTNPENEEVRRLKNYSVSSVVNPTITLEHDILSKTGDAEKDINDDNFMEKEGTDITVLTGNEYLLKLIPPLPSEIMKMMVKDLECCKCMEITMTPKMCKMGHRMCESCVGTSEQCPKCRKEATKVLLLDMETLNFAMVHYPPLKKMDPKI